LVRLDSIPWHVKNWRPNIAVFSSSVDTQDELVEMGAWLSSGRGIVTLHHLLVGDIQKLANRGLRTTSANHMQKHLLERGVHAFAECSIVNDFYQGVTTTLQTHGIAGLEPNVGLLGWGSQQDVQEDQLKNQIADERDHMPISISRLMKEIKEAITPDTVVVDDCWSSSGLLRRMLDLTGQRQFHRARQGGSIGWGLPGALGVKLGLPDKKVIAVSGDGSAAWSMQSIWTAARYKIPVTFIITNNATYRQVKLVRRIVLGDYPLNEKHDGMELDEPVMDFCMLARSMGVKAEKVDKPEDLGGVLNEAVASNEPKLVEVFVENRS